MPVWIIYALIATFFAGITAVLAKSGIENINADLGLVIRTTVLFAMAFINLLLWNGHKDWSLLTSRSLFFLVLSGITTGLCWIFYYRAMKVGDISTITVIDRGSVLITILLSVTVLKEPLTARLILGTAFIVGGLVIILTQK